MDVILYSKIKKNTDNIDDLEQIVSDATTDVIEESINKLDNTAVTVGKIAWKNGNIQDNNSYSFSDYIAVKPGDMVSVYQREASGTSWIDRIPRCVAAYDENKNILSSEGSDALLTDFIVGEHTHFVRITCTSSFLTGPWNMILINFDSPPTQYYPYYLNTEKKIAKASFIEDAANGMFGAIPSNNKYSMMAKAETLSDGETITACKNIDNKKNDTIVFYAEIDTFDAVSVGHGFNMAYGSYLTIDDTNLTTYYGTGQYFQHAHGLTLSHYVCVMIKHNHSGRADLAIYTDGGEYTVASGNIAWDGCKGDVFATSDGSSLKNVTLSCAFNDLQENVFIFGDSYVGIADPARWAYYLLNAGYTHNAIFGYGGATSSAEKKVFDNVIKMAKPKYLVWALGMNDPDTTAINATYKAKLEEVLETCSAYGIVPIVATIPNTPTVKHTFKNAYVRSLGCRIVDFASAVNATEENATWWSGMLSNDNVHPTADGAKALYRRFLADVPEATKT